MTTKLDRLLPLLTVRLTRDDWAAFEQLPEELRGWGRFLAVGPLLIGGAVVGWFSNEIDALLAFIPNFPGRAFAIGCGVVTAILLVGYLSAAVALTRRNRWRVAQRRLPATDTIIDGGLNGVDVTEDGKTTHHAWKDLTVIETASHVFLCPAPRDAIILPLRAFADPAALHLYAHTARELGRQDDDLP